MTKVERRDSVDQKVFLEKWQAGAKAGLSAQQIADSFGDGRTAATCSVRASQLRSQFTKAVEARIEGFEQAKGVKVTPEVRAKMLQQFVYDVVPELKGAKRGRKPVDTGAMDNFLDTLTALDEPANVDVPVVT